MRACWASQDCPGLDVTEAVVARLHGGVLLGVRVPDDRVLVEEHLTDLDVALGNHVPAETLVVPEKNYRSIYATEKTCF